MKFKVIKQIPKSKAKKGMIGILGGDNKDVELYDDHDSCLAKLCKPELVWINKFGFFLRGFEECGIGKYGIQKFRYQEWYCEIVEEAK